MYVVGLTGGIGSGKTKAAAALQSWGAWVLDADAIARVLTSPGGLAAPLVLSRFGTLDRQQLAATVFHDPNALSALNRIVHPLVRAEILSALACAQAPVAVLDVPLLYEAGFDDLCDEVWVLYTHHEEQIKRTMSRPGMTRADAEARIAAQMPTEEKIRRADFAVDTSGDLADTRAVLHALFQRVCP